MTSWCPLRSSRVRRVVRWSSIVHEASPVVVLICLPAFHLCLHVVTHPPLCIPCLDRFVRVSRGFSLSSGRPVCCVNHLGLSGNGACQGSPARFPSIGGFQDLFTIFPLNQLYENTRQSNDTQMYPRSNSWALKFHNLYVLSQDFIRVVKSRLIR